MTDAPEIRLPPPDEMATFDRPRRHWPLRLAVAVFVLTLLPLALAPAYSLLRPVSTLMLADLVTGGGYRRDWVPLEAIAPVLVRAVMMSEDGRFCAHDGVDWDALDLVMADPDGPSRGASTIAMQTVKNLFLWPQRSYARKALEIGLALYADRVWPKRRTIEIYLNIAEWGRGIYGAEAAAWAYFGKPAAGLDAREAALLATALPDPLGRNPADPSPGHARLADTIERRERDAGPYTACIFADAERADRLANPAALLYKAALSGAPSRAPFWAAAPARLFRRDRWQSPRRRPRRPSAECAALPTRSWRPPMSRTRPPASFAVPTTST